MITAKYPKSPQLTFTMAQNQNQWHKITTITTTITRNPNPNSPHHTIAKNDVEKVFKKFDVNGDGKISITELGSVLAELSGTVTPETELECIMKDIDTDGDGFIDLNELVASLNVGEESEELREAFELHDENGKISVNELLSVMRRLGEKCSLKDCNKLIQKFDVDGDGCVNFDEFKKIMKKWL